MEPFLYHRTLIFLGVSWEILMICFCTPIRGEVYLTHHSSSGVFEMLFKIVVYLILGCRAILLRRRGQGARMVRWKRNSIRALALLSWKGIFHGLKYDQLNPLPQHLPIFLNIKKRTYAPKSRKFRFENIWLQEANCKNIVVGF